MEEKRGGAPTRSKAQREQDLNFIAPLLIDGLPYYKIAEKLTEIRDYPVSGYMVYTDVKKLMDHWKKERLSLVDKYKFLMIERAEKMWAIACENWEKSKSGKIRTVQKQKKYKGTPKTIKGKKAEDDTILQESQRIHDESIGDPAWYGAMMSAWKLLYDCLDLKKAGRGIDSTEDNEPIPAARDVVFVTKTRRNAEYADAVEVNDDQDINTKLLQS